VGYGDGGGRPWRHVVLTAGTVSPGKIYRDARDREVEFFKLILTTQPIDLSFLEQDTPFEEALSRATKKAEPVDMWYTVLLTIVVNK
jgi:hypothetical protein